jgi:hypothetical protein
MTDEKKPATPAATQAAPQTPSTKSVGGVQSPKPDPDAKKVIDSNDVKELTAEERAEIEKATNLSGAEAKELEKALGDEAEVTGENPDFDKARKSMATIRKLVDRIHPDTPNEHTIYGAAGVVITLGDLRNISKWA